MSVSVIGIDISKEELVIAFADQSRPVDYLANKKADIQKWLSKVKSDSLVAMESTGSYHELLMDCCHRVGLMVYLINPRDSRNYAKSLGVRGKTDRTDAEILARYLHRERERLRPTAPVTASQRRASRLLSRRNTVSRHLTALRLSLKECELPEVALALEAISRLKDALEKEAVCEVDSDPVRKQGRDRMQSVPGIGRVVGASLALTFDKVGFTCVDSFIAYLGLDPRPSDSGGKQGRRRITKRGSGQLRKLLHLCAMVAIKRPEFRGLYQGYRDRGLPSTAALVIIARKIARIAFSLWKTGETYNQNKLQSALT